MSIIKEYLSYFIYNDLGGKDMTELIIIGAGPAGISAALYAKRANIDTRIIYLDNTSLKIAHKIDNYYGVKDLSGEELFNTGLKQAEALGIPLIKEEVIALEYDGNFKVITTNSTYESKALIMATGAYRNAPKIKNYKYYEGKGLSYCAVCDGFFYRKKKVAVLGNGAYALHEAEYLNNLTDELYILTNGEEIKEEKLRSFKVYDQKIEEINGQDKIEGIRFSDGTTLELNGLFVAEGTAGSSDLARKIGVLIDQNNKIITDDERKTNIDGLYAAGDAIEGMLQVAKAVYDGALAGTAVIKYLKQKH